jgi:hypothetical protein
MAIPYNAVSRDAARALEEFSEEMKSALVLGDVEPWAQALGFVRNTNALKTTFPIPLDAAGYKEFLGDFKYRSLYHRSLSMKSRTWQDGVEEFARVVEAPDFIDWGGAPARMAAEWNRLPNVIVADMLAVSSLDGPLLDFYRDADSETASTRRLFAADHPYNVLNAGLGDFDNTATCVMADITSGAIFDTLNAHFRSIMGPNGRPLGLRLQGGNVLAPAGLENVFKNTLTFDTLIRTVQEAGANVAAVTQNNIYKGTLGYKIADELENQTHFYAFAGGRPGLYPWVVQIGGTPEEFLHDKSSEKYKSSLKVAVAYVGEMEAAACLPHGVVRVNVTDA